MRKDLLAACVLACSLAAVPTKAATIVDTGPGPLVGGLSLVILSTQWAAAEFDTSQSWEITDVQGWIRPAVTGDVTFALYSDGGDVPGTELFSQSLNVIGDFDTRWVGPSGLSWLISPGTYWLAFEVRGGSLFDGNLPGPTVSPLATQAVFTLPFGWSPEEAGFDVDFGVRIFSGQPDPTVPEPATLSLLAIGLAGMGARRWRQRNAQRANRSRCT